jgi:gliding motility-associated lipoprotein GldD
MRPKSLFFLNIVVAILVIACNTPYIPKDKGYLAVSFPQKQYLPYSDPSAPYSFEIPKYASVNHEVNYFGVEKKSAAWMNLDFPIFNSTLYISYNVVQKNQFDTLMNDAYKFATNHANKASSIEDSVFTTPLGVHGVFFHIGGDVATAYQFFLTDSTRHFFRGALYFNTTPNADSLAPYNAFLLEDVKHMVNTFRWK